jgi:hypothetical protein
MRAFLALARGAVAIAGCGAKAIHSPAAFASAARSSSDVRRLTARRLVGALRITLAAITSFALVAPGAAAAVAPGATSPSRPITSGSSAPTADAGTNGCLRAIPIHLPKLNNADIRQILPFNQAAIPSGDTMKFTVAGRIEDATNKTPLSFRVFAYTTFVPFDGRAGSVTVSGENFEQIPMSVVANSPNSSGETHDLSIVLHDFDIVPKDPTRLPEYVDVAHLQTDRGLLYVACRGDTLAAWGFREITTASRQVAQIWAAAFVAVLYLLAATFVYLRRRQSADKSVKQQKLYRIEPVKAWTFRRCLNPIAMTSDNFDQGSLSKLQILFFTLLVAYNLLYLVLWEGQLFSLTTSVAYLLGIPALGTLGTQLATTTRDRFSAENWAWLVSKKVLPINDPGAGKGPQISDLVMSDSELDLYKLQALTFSIIVGISLMAAGPKALGQFQVPDTLLQVLGLSQLVLVGGRFAKPATIGDIDNLVTELRTRLAIVIRAASTGVDVDESGNPLPQATDAAGKTINLPAATPLPLPADVKSAYPAVPTAVKRFRATAAEVQVLLEAMSHRAVDSNRLVNPSLAI